MSREEHEYTFYTDVFGTDRRGNPIKVEGREHYKLLMARGGYVPFEKAQQIASDAKTKSKSEGYKPTPELEEFMREVKQCSDKDGNIRLSGRMVERMKEFGVSFDSCVPDYLKNSPVEGGVFAD